MDFVEALAKRLERRPGLVNREKLAAILTEAAVDTLSFAAEGRPIDDQLSMEQSGLIIAAIQWNHDPVIYPKRKRHGHYV